MLEPNLRAYQTEAIQSLRQGVAQKIKRQVLMSPTGSGKTEIAMAVIYGAVLKDKRVVFLCNRINLVNQASKRFYKAGISHGIIQGQNTRNTDKKVIIASIQTVAKRAMPECELIVIDEVHGASGSAEYRKVIFDNKDKTIIGLTATPWSKGMGKVYPELDDEPLFQKMTVATTIGELITQGFLVDCDIYAPEDPDMSGFKLKKNSFGELDYSDADVGKAVDKPKLIGGIVEHWLKLAKDTPTVCFASNISHSKHIVEEFRAAGVQAEHIDCYTDEFERAAILKRVEIGETMVISNVGILTEGWDFPACKTMILARPTRSLIRYIQMIGRVLRPHSSKERALVLDHSGTVAKLGFPTDDFPMELDDGKAKANTQQEKKELLPTVCQSCKFVKPRKSPVCPNCGHVNVTPTVEVEAGELKKLEKKEKVTMEDKQLWWSSFLRLAHEKKKTRSWALAQYRQKFGVWPKGLEEVSIEPIQGVRSWVTSRSIAWANSQKKGAT